jgi:hypothetical protein
MKRYVKWIAVGIVAMLGVALLQEDSISLAQNKEATLLAHDVYFTLKDNSPAAKKKLVDACKKYLSGHEGEVFFATGTRDEAFKREVNDTQFDVSLLIVFKSVAAHNQYQDAKRHIEFINENKANWKTVRVFDSAVQR